MWHWIKVAAGAAVAYVAVLYVASTQGPALTLALLAALAVVIVANLDAAISRLWRLKQNKPRDEIEDE